MKLYSQNKYYKLYNGSMLDMREAIEPESIDSIVTDPPYELSFMNKGWDSSGIAFQKETWEKCYEVLKPGGYLLAFGGSRTFHRIACAIEDAGFEVRDVIMWLYGSGFPKSMNIGLAIDKKNGVESKIVGYAKTSMPDFRDVGEKQKEISGVDKLSFGQIENSARKQQPIYEAQNQWSGWGTALKPSYEPIIVARKPCEGSCIENVVKYGVGGINIDECRVGNEEIKTNGGNKFPNLYGDFNECEESTHSGRFPANTILTYNQSDESEVCGGFPNVDSGSAARYYYCAKTSKKDRDEGLDSFEEVKISDGSIRSNEESARKFGANPAARKNIHPTVKPTELMQYLVRLVTPNGGTVLDPFNGSGSTGKACMYENKENDKQYKYIGIELTEEYLPIADARIRHVLGIKKEVESRQMTIFDFMGV